MPSDASVIAAYERERMATAGWAITLEQDALLEVVSMTKAIDNSGKQATG